jgi:hypothetical protein
MDRFTARNALETGFDLIRRRPLLVLLWAAVLLAQTLVYASAARELAAIAREGIFSGRPASAYNGQALALTVVNSGVSLVVAALLWSSAFRALLRPAERRALAFGAAELAVFTAWLIIQLVAFGASIPLQMLIVGFFRAVNPRLFLDLFIAVTVLSLFWSAVASVWAFGRGQIAPFRCWTIARGRFWLLAGLVVGVAVLDRVAGVGIGELATALRHLLPVAPISPSEPFGAPAPSVKDVFQAPALLRDVLSAAVGALEIAFIAGVVACTYRASGQEPQAASFSSVVSGPAS